MPCRDRSCAPAQRPPMPRAEEKQTLSVSRCTPVEFFDMAAPHFVHLRMHSEYSVTDGIVRIEQAVKRAAADGDVGQALLSAQSPLAERLARDWAKLFPGRYYIELQRAGFANAEALLSRSVALATRVGLPVVATHPVQFLEPEDFKAHEARVCIAQGYVLGDQRRPKLFTAEQYFKRRAEMVKLFADLPQALDNSVEIARRCNLEIELGKSRLPAFPTPPGVT